MATWTQSQQLPTEQPTMSDLFGRILSRVERDYERDRPGLIRDAMSLLWAARSGLSDRSGLLGFAYSALSEAVVAIYLPKPEKQASAHAVLADYFAKFDGQPRSIEELPWQLEHSSQWHRLREVLSKPNYPAGMGLSNEPALRRMWAAIERHTGTTSQEAARPLLKKTSALGLGALLTIESLGWSDGDLEIARKSIEEVVRRVEGHGDSLALAALLKNLADIHQRLGHDQYARDLLDRARGISARLGDQDGTASSLLSEVALRMESQDYDGAIACAQRAAEIFRKTGNRRGLRASLTNAAGGLTMLGRVGEAKTIHREEEAIAKETEDWEGLAKSLNNQGSLEARYGDLQKALALFTKAEGLSSQFGLAQD